MPEPSKNHNRTNRERKHPLEYWIFAFVVLTAGATATAAYYTREQWRTANDSLIVSQRAFVSFGEQIPFVGHDVQKGEVIGVVIPIINNGNTRTRDLEFRIKCATATNKMDEPWALFRQGKVEHRPLVLPPKDKATPMCAFSFSDVAEMASGKLVGYLLGEISYKDVFTNVKHLTRMSMEATYVRVAPTKDGGGQDVNIQWQNRGQQNCADEDCPND